MAAVSIFPDENLGWVCGRWLRPACCSRTTNLLKVPRRGLRVVCCCGALECLARLAPQRTVAGRRAPFEALHYLVIKTPHVDGSSPVACI